MIEFQGVDIVVQKRPADAGVRQALAVTLGVPEGRVALVDDLSDYPEAGAADVVCVRSSVEGEFSDLLSIQADRLTAPYETALQLVARLGELLGAECLVPDEDSQNPYLMWLILPGSAPLKVALDTIAFDRGQYVIARNQ